MNNDSSDKLSDANFYANSMCLSDRYRELEGFTIPAADGKVLTMSDVYYETTVPLSRTSNTAMDDKWTDILMTFVLMLSPLLISGAAIWLKAVPVDAIAQQITQQVERSLEP